MAKGSKTRAGIKVEEDISLDDFDIDFDDDNSTGAGTNGETSNEETSNVASLEDAESIDFSTPSTAVTDNTLDDFNIDFDEPNEQPKNEEIDFSDEDDDMEIDFGGEGDSNIDSDDNDGQDETGQEENGQEQEFVESNNEDWQVSDEETSSNIEEINEEPIPSGAGLYTDTLDFEEEQPQQEDQQSEQPNTEPEPTKQSKKDKKKAKSKGKDKQDKVEIKESKEQTKKAEDKIGNSDKPNLILYIIIDKPINGMLGFFRNYGVNVSRIFSRIDNLLDEDNEIVEEGAKDTILMQVDPSRIVFIDTGTGRFTNMGSRKALVDLIGVSDQDTKISIFYTDSVIESEISSNLSIDLKKIDWHKYVSTTDVLYNILRKAAKENYVMDMEDADDFDQSKISLDIKGFNVHVPEQMELGVPSITASDIEVHRNDEKHAIAGYAVKY